MSVSAQKANDDDLSEGSIEIFEDSDDDAIVGDKRKSTEEAKDKGAQSAGDPAKPTEEEIQLKVTKRARNVKPFTEELLVGPYGLSKIYHEFPLRCKYKKGQEVQYIRQLMTLYKEWAFQLHPGFSFEDVLLKCDTLSSKGRVRSHMQELREQERLRYRREVVIPRQIAARGTRSPSPPSSPAAPTSDSPSHPPAGSPNTRQSVEDENLIFKPLDAMLGEDEPDAEKKLSVEPEQPASAPPSPSNAPSYPNNGENIEDDSESDEDMNYQSKKQVSVPSAEEEGLTDD